MKVLTQSVEDTYKRVFGHSTEPDDKNRIVFLQEVVTGEVEYTGKKLGIEEAVSIAEKERADLLEDFKHVGNKEEKESMAGKLHGFDKLLQVYEAASEVRQWYLRSETSCIQEGKIDVAEPLLKAGMQYVCDELVDCMTVLKTHRIQSLIDILDDAMRTPKNKDQVIRTVTESLLAKNVPELTNAVVDKMREYHFHLKNLLVSALEEKNELAIKYAAARLNNTGVPELQRFTQEYLKEYHS